MKVKVVKHYHQDDIDFGMDYSYIEIFIEDQKVQEYGDDYCDKGQDKTHGFLDGIASIAGYIDVEYEDVADKE